MIANSSGLEDHNTKWSLYTKHLALVAYYQTTDLKYHNISYSLYTKQLALKTIKLASFSIQIHWPLKSSLYLVSLYKTTGLKDDNTV